MSTHESNGANGLKPAHRSPLRFQGCSKIGEYKVLGKLGEGTFGEVHRAEHRKTGEIVALKKILMHNEKDGFPITALREIKLLKLLNHQNILKLEEMAIENNAPGKDKKKRAIMYMVTPYMDHDLSGLLDNPDVHFTESHIKCYMLQLLEGIRYMHDQSILHRDIKAANILINNKGILQIADFGLARVYDDEVPRAGNGGGVARREYTSLVVTRWYRPPELLMNFRKYTSAIDIWGIGCVFGEMLVGKPILAGESDQRQLELIFELMGSPTDENMPGWQNMPGAQGLKPRSPPTPSTLSTRFREYGSGAISLLNELLKLDWRRRTNAIDALKHPYFRNQPLPSEPGSIPRFEESHELDRRNRGGQKRGPPPPPKGGTVGMGPENGWNGSGNGGFNGGRNDYRGLDRGQAGGRHPPGGYRDGPPSNYPQPGRRPAWDREPRSDSRAPDTRLPPRPPPPVDSMPPRGAARYDGGRPDDRQDYRDRGRDRPREDREAYPPPPRSRGGDSSTSGGRADIDTYIPSYRGGQDEGRREDRLRDRDREDRRRWDDRDDRRYDRPPLQGTRERLDYGDDRGRSGHTRSRSRSPLRERDGRVREREPLDRDREYRR